MLESELKAVRETPVFYNGANGYDSYSGNPIGRVVTVGVRGNF
jgi:hypothetical protein